VLNECVLVNFDGGDASIANLGPNYCRFLHDDQPRRVATTWRHHVSPGWSTASEANPLIHGAQPRDSRKRLFIGREIDVEDRWRLPRPKGQTFESILPRHG